MNAELSRDSLKMFCDHYNEVAKWNKERGLTYNPVLAEKLLLEEITESYAALTDYFKNSPVPVNHYRLYLENILDGVCDVAFVALGNWYKAEDKEYLGPLYDYLHKYLDPLLVRTYDVLSDVRCEDYMPTMLEYCFEEVINTNYLKGSKKDPNGKVIKQPGLKPDFTDIFKKWGF